ncbi:restriction endonuclease subunit S [Vibrio mimicus]|uniref:restriction endonuclease subunit S n=1 Tax=Vibrio mimicus TaxID=674 RepID=UPI002F950B68
MVPNGWVKAAIKQLGDVSAGRQRSPNFTEGSVRPYLRVANVFEAFIDTNDVNEMPFTDKEFERYKLEPGDILLNEGQSTELVGRPAMYKGEPANCCFQNTLVRFKANDQVNQNYALQRFLLCLYDGTFQSISKKTTSIAHLGVSRFADLKLAWPPLFEQNKIAQILSTWDEAITTTEQLLANSQQQKIALMQQLLTGKKRLLDKNGVRFEGEWKWLKANELFRTVSTKNNSETEELLAVTQDQGVLPRSLLERRVAMPDGSTKGYKLVVPGNFIISLRSFQGGLEYSNYRGLVSPAYTVLEPIRSIDDEFYKQYYKSYDFIGHLAVAVIGIRDGKQISYSDFSFLKLPYPGLEEQQKIAAVLSTADQEISALQQKLDALKQEKKALMQQLLTGKRRVKIDDKEVA